jgi:dTDP-4-dehydrorhamnose reductase
MDILILGHKGMLGHMLVKYLTDMQCSIYTTNDRYSTDEFKQYVSNFNGDYIINCIGAIPQKTNQFNINYELPIWLDKNSKCKIIHPGTDCEIDNDDYGISKYNASDYIKLKGLQTKILQTSIIGPELNSNYSLFEWFLSSKNDVKGYTKVMWNGITTLEWAKQCYNLINNWNKYENKNIIESTCLSKYDLLFLIKEIFNKNINIIPEGKININKCLKGNIKSSDIKIQLQELKNYYYENNDFIPSH